MNRTEMINDFKNFLRENQENLQNHITKIEDISPDDEWALEDEWDEDILQKNSEVVAFVASKLSL